METLHEGRFLRLVRKQGWEWVERVNAKGVVVIAAVTPDDEIVLIEQHRPPVGGIVVELPAGLVGDERGLEDEDRAVAAGRELVEETGFEAASLTLAFEGPSSAGMSRETIAIYLARGVRKVAAGGGVAGEDIATHLVPLRDVDAWLAERMASGVLVDPKVYTGLYWLARR